MPEATPLGEPLGLRHPQAEHVHQGIAGVSRLERDLAPHRGDADAVAVPRDARDHPVDEAHGVRRGPALLVLEGAEPQRVEEGDGPRPHRENVADDAADAGRRPLVGLDERGMVVGLDLEHGREAVADVDRARVLPRPLQHPRAVGGETPQVPAGALVAAVLGPHHREDPQLGERRLAAENLHQPAVLLRAQPVRVDGGLLDHAAPVAAIAATTDSSTTRPSSLPRADSHAALGMRHEPDDVAAAVADAGDSAQRPVGIGGGGRRALGVAVAEDDLPVRLEGVHRLRRGVVAALAVRDRQPQHLAGRRPETERGVGLLDPDVDVPAQELQPAVPQQGALEQAGLEQHLEPVADADDRPAGAGELADPPPSPARTARSRRFRR